MVVDFTIICVAVALLATTALVKRIADRLELERHTITPEELRELLASNTDAFVVDAREPLDLLGDSVIIPGAVWFAPRQVLDDPSLLPARRDLVVYCTWPNDKTNRVPVRLQATQGSYQFSWHSPARFASVLTRTRYAL